MYLKGDVKTIEEVERVIRSHTLYFRKRDGSGEFKVGDQSISSLMFCRQFYVDIGWRAVGIKLIFDYRNNTGAIRIKDSHLQKLVKRVPDIGKALEPLRPFYGEVASK